MQLCTFCEEMKVVVPIEGKDGSVRFICEECAAHFQEVSSSRESSTTQEGCRRLFTGELSMYDPETPPTQPLPPRPEVLDGTTYKIKTPNSEHAFYVTINDILIDGKRRPFEIFINSKSMESLEWMVALTRVLSATFRREENAVFLVDELLSIFDARGGYFKPGGKRMPSIVAEIGDCLERHLTKTGVISSPEQEKRPA
ncbi:MAG: hypothetical protein HQL74_16060 [Magnetococcales bacterium]|nr:hypothetical protein [Magnetococcales bacterium]